MPRFTVTMTRTYDFTYDVEADTPEEAVALVEDGDVEEVDTQPGEDTFIVEDENENVLLNTNK